MTDGVLILVIWIIGVIAFGIWGQIVIKEVFDAIKERANDKRTNTKRNN